MDLKDDCGNVHELKAVCSLLLSLRSGVQKAQLVKGCLPFPFWLVRCYLHSEDECNWLAAVMVQSTNVYFHVHFSAFAPVELYVLAPGPSWRLVLPNWGNSPVQKAVA